MTHRYTNFVNIFQVLILTDAMNTFATPSFTWTHATVSPFAHELVTQLMLAKLMNAFRFCPATKQFSTNRKIAIKTVIAMLIKWKSRCELSTDFSFKAFAQNENHKED